MNRKTIVNSVVLFVLLTSMVIYYKYDTGKKNKIMEQLKTEYSSITIDENFIGVVSEIQHPYPELFKRLPHQAFILLNDSVKKRISTGYELTKEITLDSILNVGDQLTKKYGSDTLHIHKIQGSDTLVYSFQLRDDSGYPLKRKD